MLVALSAMAGSPEMTLAGIAGKSGEPWHRTESGGFLRNVVYGFNDGLTANFGLVAGVIGAAASRAAETTRTVAAWKTSSTAFSAVRVARAGRAGLS